MYLVYGLQKSGIAVTKFFEKINKEFKIWDDNHIVRRNLKNQFDKHLFINPASNDLTFFKKIFVSPGISLRQKKFQFRNKILKVNRDLNLYISNINNQKVIAITGTNGKSTTTKLIGDILKKNNLKTFVGGNIGAPLCDALISDEYFKFHVIELSSFQLETIKNLPTKISIITNLANDHLDRYKNINDYINQKKNIITKKGINLFSIDDKYSRKIFKKKNIKNKISFSILDKSADVYMSEGIILDNYFKKNRRLYIKKISKDLEGHFNYQNILIAYIACKLLKLPEKVFIDVIKNFKGLPFRSSIIFENKNLKVINNSKSTNLNSTINSIKNYNKIFLILGGIAKEKNFEILLNYKEKITSIYVYGKSASIIEKKLKNSISVKRYKNLKILVNQLLKDVKKIKAKSNILFAPACSSYDQYKNFEERGTDFTNLINSNLKKL